MKKNLLRLSAWAMLMALAMTSCVTERDEAVASNDGSLVINILSEGFEVPVTRAAVDNQTSPTTETENTITLSSTVIGIFDASGNVIKVATPEVVDGNLTLAETQTGTDWLASAASIYVAANLPAANVTALTALTSSNTKSDFETAVNMAITAALNSNSLTGTQIPMFGAGSVTPASTGTYTATVNVEHMLTKVTLNSLGVDFSQSATPNASFQPEQVFLINVPDNVGINSSTGVIAQAAPSNWYMGEVAGATGTGASTDVGDLHSVPTYSTTYTTGYTNHFNAADYLGTAALADQTVMCAEKPTWLKTATAGSQVRQQYYFYTMPNLNATTVNDQTKLVIRGAFKENSSAAATEVYYAVPLNRTERTLAANKNYQVDVIIKQKGATDAYADLPNDITSTLSVTYNVTSFSDTPTSVIIGNGTADTNTTAIDAVPKVGDFFYNDGTWSSEYDTKSGTRTLVGLVFSTNVSTTDEVAGYTHGYVMALTDAGYNYGGTPETQKYKWAETVPSSGSKTAGLFSIGSTLSTQYTDDAGYFAAWKADMDGLTHTNLMAESFTGYDGTAADPFAGVTAAGEYPAAYAAKITYNNAVHVPTTGTNKTSGWYLPSCGQLYDLAYNFGGRTAWSGMSIRYSKNNQDQYNEYHNCYFSGAADATTTAINNYLSARLGDAAGLTAGAGYQAFIARTSSASSVYWSSSDYSAFYGLNLSFSSDGDLGFYCNGKTNEYSVRPVLAF